VRKSDFVKKNLALGGEIKAKKNPNCVNRAMKRGNFGGEGGKKMAYDPFGGGATNSREPGAVLGHFGRGVGDSVGGKRGGGGQKGGQGLTTLSRRPRA